MNRGDIMSYEKLSSEIENRIIADRKNGKTHRFAFLPENAFRRDNGHDAQSVLRSAFIRDTEKILHCPYYNRYADKTQVFSFYKNDDITHRFLHVQLVSRIARTIGTALNLNLDLIEAIALGHDIGHTPFGHIGERLLDEIYFKHTSLHFAHNVHSVRVLDQIIPYNISLPTLNDILSHDGELELERYEPKPISSFLELDEKISKCKKDLNFIKTLIPCTLEGCVVRISDIIAYLGKDRQDAVKLKITTPEHFDFDHLGSDNAEIMNNLMINIIEHSYGKPFIKMDKQHFTLLKQSKSNNYENIYSHEKVSKPVADTIKPLMEKLYDKLLNDLIKEDKNSYIYTHHINKIN
jgi:dGTPase